VALAAVSVDGRCRERNPADLAIFGAERDQLVERFAVRASGQALFARATTDGAAEGAAVLLTAAGAQPFRISLWRQRGGDKIRVLAAFAACDGAEPLRPAPDHGATPPAMIGHEMGGTIDAVLGLAEGLRASGEAAAVATDLLSAAWRLRRLADELIALDAGAAEWPRPVVAEVDVARLLRRVLRLRAPAAVARDVTLAAPELPARGAGPMVLTDERALWSTLDILLARAIARSAAQTTLSVGLEGGSAGQDLEIALDPGEADAAHDPTRPDTVLAERLARAAGAQLSTEADGASARLRFPAARCLGPE